MNSKEIKDLISFISNSGLWEVNLETENIKLSIKRGVGSNAPAVPLSVVEYVPQTQHTQSAQELPQANPNVPTPQESAPSKSTNTVTIKSPMIGTFYRSSSPDSPPFKNVGDPVKKGEVVCIVEAMKLFNEIESEVSGKIVKVLVDNASPVEYDQPLFLVEL